MDYRIPGRTGVPLAPLALGSDNFMDPTPAVASFHNTADWMKGAIA